MTSLRQALDRTLLLMRDVLTEAATDADLLGALTTTEVALVADAENLASHSAQCAFVTSAMLMARSGHRVYLVAPDVPLHGAQPPLDRHKMVSGLVDIGRDLLPSVEFSPTIPPHKIDLQVLFGDVRLRLNARRTLSINADAWSGRLSPRQMSLWPGESWPLGGLSAAGLVSVEAFKIAMRRLKAFAANVRYFDALFADQRDLTFALASPSSPRPTALGSFDVISAGAIANNALYVLARIPEVVGQGRVWDEDIGDASNLNRNALLLRSRVHEPKVNVLASSFDFGGLAISAVPENYGATSTRKLAPRVLVGVDHIPSRWEVQRARPLWLGVGATSHWACMASFHTVGLACAGCLHPEDDREPAIIPTVAFVSYWAGLLLAAYFLRAAGDEVIDHKLQQVYFSPLRPEEPRWMPVPIHKDCPVQNHLAV